MSRARDLSKLSSPSNFTVDANNNIGVNSTSPDAKFDVVGVVSATKYFGDGSELTGITAGGLSGAPDITIGNITGVAATFTGDMSVRNITGVAATFTGVLTYEDVTNIDSIGIITARSGVSIGDSIFHTGDSNTAIRFPANDTFTVETAGSETARFTSSAITFKAPDGGSRYNFGELGNSAHAELSLYNSSDSQKVRIAANNDTFFNGGNVIVNGTTTGSSAKFEVRSTTGSISSATVRLNGDATDTGAINTGSSLLFAGHDGGNASRDFASIFAGKENGTGSNYAAYLAFGTRSNGSTLAEKLRIASSGDLLIGLTAAVGEGGTPADLNSTEIGRGFINLSRDDTAAADHILFGKNGAIAASVGTDTTNTLVFKTGTTERLRITSAGRFGFHTTSPDAEVHIEPVSTNASILLSNDGRTQWFRIQNNETDDALVFNANDTNERLRITSAGGVRFAGGPLEEKIEERSNDVGDDANFNVMNGNVLAYTGAANAAGARTINIRGNASTAYNDITASNHIVSLTVIHRPNSNDYINAYTVDGNANGQNSYSISIQFLGGSAPSSASASAYEVHNISLIKSADKSYQFLVAVSEYA